MKLVCKTDTKLKRKFKGENEIKIGTMSNLIFELKLLKVRNKYYFCVSVGLWLDHIAACVTPGI